MEEHDRRSKKFDSFTMTFETSRDEDRVEVIEQDLMKRFLQSLSLAEHVGDVNSSLQFYAPQFGPEFTPKWSDELNRYTWPWEEPEDLEDE